MRILFTHAHLIIDQNKEYLDGALLVNDQRIEDVFLHSNNLPDIAGDYTTIDLNGSIVMPGFFDTHTHGISGIDYDLSDKKNWKELLMRMLYQEQHHTFIPYLMI